MDLFHTGVLIRSLIVLAMLGLLVIAGALFALREKRRIASSVADAPGLPDADAAVKDGAPRYRLDRGECEANDSGASAPVVHRRAA